MKKVFVDTNILLNEKFTLENYEKVYMSIVSIEELDKLKKIENTRYHARRAIRNIQNATNVDVRMDTFDSSVSNDNRILALANEIYSNEDGEVVFFTDDYALKIKADAFNLPCKLFEYNKDAGYKGYAELIMTSDEITQLFDELEGGINNFGFLDNQYVVINEEEKNKPHEFRFVKGKLKQLKLPDSKFIKGVNSQQRFALDLLYNEKIPIKIIAGTYGSGKSFLTTKMALHSVFETGMYGQILLLRNPLGSGEEIGFLKGDKDEKIGDFFKCIEQYIDPTVSKDKNIEEYIKKDIPYYIKGMSYGSTFVFVDEAEDMDLTILKLIGSRIESDSCVVFCGDYKQSEAKYKNDNGLYKMIEKLKGNPLVGIVVLEEDVRSEASKVFSLI